MRIPCPPVSVYHPRNTAPARVGVGRTKLGAHIVDEGDRLVVYGDGGKSLHGGEVESFKDHRIVMSLACLGLGLKEGEQVTVNDAQWCSVTFPKFFEVMNEIGAGFETK